MTQALLLGSGPFNSMREFYDVALSELGEHLIAVPNGSPNRPRWVVDVINRLATQTAFYTKKEGDWSDYDHASRLGLRVDTLNTFDINLGYNDLFEEEIHEYLDAMERFGLNIPYLETVPHPFDTSIFALGPVLGFRNRKAFYDAVVREMHRIYSSANIPLIFQIEYPVPTVGAMQVPLLIPLLSYLVAPQDFIAVGGRVGGHPCLGDLGHKAKGKLKSVRRMMSFVNSVDARALRNDSVFEYMHVPLAEGDKIPVTDPSFYDDFCLLNIHPKTKLVAGFLHEGLTDSEVGRILGSIRRAVKRSSVPDRVVHVAASCGLARRPREAAMATIRQAKWCCER
jgi:hypothetical protein